MAKQVLESEAKSAQRLTGKASKMHTTEAAANEARDEWEKQVLDSYDCGLTYNEIAAISSKSRVRIDQVIRAERQRRGLRTNATA